MNKKLLLLLIPAVALLGCCIAILCVISMPSGGYEVYTQNIEQAEKYLSSSNYDEAIKYYEAAIEADDTQADAYIKLAAVYHDHKGDIETAISWLKKAQDKKVFSELIETALAQYTAELEGTADASAAISTDEVSLKTTTLEMFGDYTYEQYSSSYTVESENYQNGVYTVRYVGIDAEITYSDTNGVKVIDSKNMKPYSYAYPTEIKADGISSIITVPSTGLSFEELKGLTGVTDAVTTYDKTLQKNLVTFMCGGCSVTLECDENGTILPSSSVNTVTPNSVGEEQSFKVSGKVVSATTGEAVSDANAKVSVRSGTDVKSGGTVESVSAGSGKYSVQLDSGDYTFEVSADGYDTEYYNITVDDKDVSRDFSISKTLNDGEIKIVLEWTNSSTEAYMHAYCNSASNADSGESYSGQLGSVSAPKQASTVKKGSTVVAESNRDESAKRETTIWYDTSAKITYHVHGDYTASDVVVKVYLPGESEPTVITNPSGLGNGSYWTVCKIENGVLEICDKSDQV